MRRFDQAHRGDVEWCKLDVLEYWMHNSEHVSWQGLAGALSDVGSYGWIVHSLMRKEEGLRSALKHIGSESTDSSASTGVTDFLVAGGLSVTTPFGQGTEDAKEESGSGNGMMGVGMSADEETGPAVSANEKTEPVTTIPSLYDQAQAESGTTLNLKAPTDLLLADELVVETQRIQTTFNVLFSRVCELMEQREVSVERLVFFLEGQSALEGVSVFRPAPSVLGAEIPVLRKMTSLKEVFRVLRSYCSFFNDVLLSGIIEMFCRGDEAVEKAHTQLNLQLVHYFSQRLCDCPHTHLFIIEPIKDWPIVRMKIDRKWASVHVGQLAYLRDSISRVLHLKRYTLVLCAAEKGCMELAFAVPKFVMENIFLTCKEISERRRHLGDLGVLNISFEREQVAHLQWNTAGRSLEQSQFGPTSSVISIECIPRPGGNPLSNYPSRQTVSNEYFLPQRSRPGVQYYSRTLSWREIVLEYFLPQRSRAVPLNLYFSRVLGWREIVPGLDAVCRVSVALAPVWVPPVVGLISVGMVALAPVWVPPVMELISGGMIALAPLWVPPVVRHILLALLSWI